MYFPDTDGCYPVPGDRTLQLTPMSLMPSHQCAGRRRLLRMLQQLQSRAAPRHAQLLLSICRASPPLASAFLVSMRPRLTAM